MTFYNLLKTSELGETRYDRDAVLKSVFGFTDKDLATIRVNRNLIDRVFKAASTLVDKLRESDTDPTIIPAQITLSNLALLVDDGSYETSPPLRIVKTALKREYFAKKVRINEETGLNPTYTQLLREDVGIYEGNLYQAKQRWPNLKVSPFDWLKDVRIPTKIGFDEAILLGIFYTHGTILHHSKDKKTDYMVELYGRNCDFDFYEGVLLPLIKKLNNTIPRKPSKKRLPANAERVYYTYNVPSYEICSVALVSWLKSMGMSNSWSDRDVPNLRSQEQKLGFFKGVVASLGNLYIYPEKTLLRIETRNTQFIGSLKRLSEELGVSPAIGKNGTKLDYSKSNVVKMRRNNILMNPHHINKLRLYNLL